MESFEQEVTRRLAENRENGDLQQCASALMQASFLPKYSYNFFWLGRPIIQYPQDIVALQEIIWRVKPDLVIETGIAHGGSLVLSASILALLEYSEAVENGIVLNPRAPNRKVLGIDIDIRPHNRRAIERHPMAHRIEMIEASSVDPRTVSQVRLRAEASDRILVCLDSNHTYEHVMAELEAYAPLVTSGSYCVVFDTVIEDLPEDFFPNRPWGKGNNPRTAVDRYLEGHPEFSVDTSIDSKLLVSVAPNGYLRRS